MMYQYSVSGQWKQSDSESPTIVFACPSCGKKLQVCASLGGRGGTCPFCGNWAVAPLRLCHMPLSDENAPSGAGEARDAAAPSSGAEHHSSADGAGAVVPCPSCPPGGEKMSSGKQGFHPADVIVPGQAAPCETRLLLKIIVAVILVLLVCGIVAWLVCGMASPHHL
jgi:hypothetical protein